MRLLEFEQAQGSVESHHLAHIASRVAEMDEEPASLERRPVAPPARRTSPKTWEFGVKDTSAKAAPATAPPARKQIDLENLLQRIEVLENRVKSRLENLSNDNTRPELEKIRLRLTNIERNLTNELWAAKQREHSLLELLTRPPLAVRVRKEYALFRNQHLPAFWGWLKATAHEWWHDQRPQWWLAINEAWQEALAKARRI